MIKIFVDDIIIRAYSDQNLIDSILAMEKFTNERKLKINWKKCGIIKI